MRSRSAAASLISAGLKNVYSLEGGIRAWKGMVAHGVPEAGMAYFSPAADVEEIVGLAWSLEEGSKLFYQGVAGYFPADPEARKVFEELVAAEKNHEKHLLETYQALTGVQADFVKLRERYHDSLGGAVMEGGVKVEEGLAWIRGKGVVESLELAMAMEVNAYDLYIKMSRAVDDKPAQQIFKKLSEEEQLHLKKLAGLLDRRI